MAHDLKAYTIQLNELENRYSERIVSKNIISYSQDFSLNELDLVHKAWVKDYLDPLLPDGDIATKKHVIRESGKQSISFSWQDNNPDIGSSFADLYGDFPTVQMYQKSGQSYFLVNPNLSFTITNDGQADIITVTLDNLDTILIIQ